VDILATLSAALDDRYEVERELGHGGMAYVFAARDRRVPRRVAIKVLRPDLAESIGPDRFLREIEIEARLQHPHILPLFDSGVARGLPYYVMQFIEGETLRERLEREVQLPIAEALRIAGQVADALDYAHGRGVIHRDIKPENILLAGDHAYVADFGIARAASAAGGEWHSARGTAVWRTETGIVIGTIGYMSPEQATATPQLDGRSDQYGLASVVYEMLAGNGETPFSGASLQVVVAKLITLPPPSVRIVREKVPGIMDDALQRALSRTPADRFKTCGEFLAALERKPSWWDRIKDVAGMRTARVGGVAGSVAVTALVLWLLFSWAGGDLEADRVLVFPLAEARTGTLTRGAGETVARVIISALEQTEPLKWLDGWIWLDEEEREDIRHLTAPEARRMSRDRQARYQLGGSIIERGDSASVVLWLYDAAADSVVAQRSASGGARIESLVQTGLRAATALLPALLEPGQRVDLSALTDRDISAVALWMQGEVEYRHARFLSALELYQRAVATDSALAMAALKGAQAASWKGLIGDAEKLVQVALAQEGALPLRHRYLAEGLKSYLAGGADSAVARLQLALEADPEWSDAWMALGEVYYHLLPDAFPRDSLAEASFRRAATLDPEFTPSLVHLLQSTVWRGEAVAGGRLMDRLRRAEPDTAIIRQLELMLDCVRAGPGRAGWAEAAVGNADRVLQAAAALAPAARQSECAKAGFRAYLGSGKGTQIGNWDALIGLQGLLVAEGKHDSVERLLDSAVAGGLDWANMLYVVDAVEGLNLGAKAEAYLEQYRGDYRAVPYATRLWALGLWESHRRNVEAATAIAAELDRRAEAGGSRQGRLLADLLAARAALARADTLQALGLMRQLRPTAPRNDLFWSPFESLAAERLDLAELLFAAGELDAAAKIANECDQLTAPMACLVYLPRSLALQASIARARGDARLAYRYDARLVELGRADLVGSEP
jgi:hypothetical protein